MPGGPSAADTSRLITSVVLVEGKVVMVMVADWTVVNDLDDPLAATASLLATGLVEAADTESGK